MKIDIETIFLVLIITFLIYNYYNGDYYRVINYDMDNVFSSDNNHCNRHRDRFTGFPLEPRLPKARSSFNKLPEIMLEGLDNKIDDQIENKLESIALPNEELLNDRYNTLLVNYTDTQLQGIINNPYSNSQLTDNSEYNDLLINDIQKNILSDIDSKLYKKSQRNQKLSKDSKTIASNFGRNALLETYRNEIEEFQEKRAWWEENVD